MSTTQISQRVGALIAIAAGCLAVATAAAQQPAPSKAGAAAEQASASSEAAAKEKILASAQWKQAYDEFQKWLASQAIFRPADVERIKGELWAQIQVMPASDLQGFLDDWQAKLKLLGDKNFQDAQQWLGEFMSAMAEGFRRQTLRDFGLDDFANMSASQLEDALIGVRARRLALQQQQSAFDRNRQQRIQTVRQSRAATQQALQEQPTTGAAQFGTNQSPYRPPKFNPPPAVRRQFFVDGDGRIGFILPH